MREGSIVEQGNHDNLMKLNRDYAAMFNHFQLGDPPYIEAPARKSSGSQKKRADSKQGSVKKNAAVIKENGEEQQCGGVAWPVFRHYMVACGGSTSCLLILVLFVLNVGSSTFCQWWLSYWINQGSGVRLVLPFITSPSSCPIHLLFVTSSLPSSPPSSPLPLSPPPAPPPLVSSLSLLLQNTTVTRGNSSMVSVSMKDNPMMQHYAAVYASSMGVMLLLKLFRGIVFVKVRTSHSPVTSLMCDTDV
ncbi:ATP-binding cassette sub-family C member 5-like isoform X1 [Epinephelus moara]|uniref:ATP-binding cassette sub-family C member 5-like isoform X1 n=1 Tax=Epinephelus moara TaxID=300413 RepID=UPI00214EEBA3|nr:ATP-binding cassette sub-family C member 5-like isoform X1 [Epinephelus moara]